MNNYLTNPTSTSVSGSSFNKLHGSLATPQSRLVTYLLDAILMGATFGIGWLIWFAVIAGRGTTPGHDLMGQRIVDVKTGQPLTFGKMFLRECIFKGILSMVLGSLTMFINYLVDGALIFRDDRRTVHDHLVGSEVIQERSSALFDKLQSL